MKQFTVVGLSFGMALLLAGPALADPSSECGISNASQVDIADCVQAIEKSVDKVVDMALGYAMESAQELDATTGRDDAVPALTASQKTWGAFRDAQCDFVGSTFGGGSGTGIAISSCRIELGRQREASLMNGLD
ncbi:MAG: lysozyme inhibitor LprI family protein [Paracoccaceae bacterium]